MLTQTPYGKDDGSIGGSSALERTGRREQLSRPARLHRRRGRRPRHRRLARANGDCSTRSRARTERRWSTGRPSSPTPTATSACSARPTWASTSSRPRPTPGSSHVKAMFPIISGNDLYRDTAFAGGFPDIEFSAFYLGLTAGLNLLLPADEGNSDFATALIDHVHDLTDFDAALLANARPAAMTPMTRPTGALATRSSTSSRSSPTTSRRSWSAAGTTCSSAASCSTTRASRTPTTAGRRWRAMTRDPTGHVALPADPGPVVPRDRRDGPRTTTG